MEITDMNQATVASYRYDPYGNVTITVGGTPQSTDPLGQHWAYTGRFLDEESGLLYYRARHYDPETGRFLQRDPLGYNDSPCLYEYVATNPASLRDASGLATQTIRIAYNPGIDNLKITIVVKYECNEKPHVISTSMGPLSWWTGGSTSRNYIVLQESVSASASVTESDREQKPGAGNFLRYRYTVAVTVTTSSVWIFGRGESTSVTFPDREYVTDWLACGGGVARPPPPGTPPAPNPPPGPETPPWPPDGGFGDEPPRRFTMPRPTTPPMPERPFGEPPPMPPPLPD
jgi:RHS repeat-associated protein